MNQGRSTQFCWWVLPTRHKTIKFVFLLLLLPIMVLVLFSMSSCRPRHPQSTLSRVLAVHRWSPLKGKMLMTLPFSHIHKFIRHLALWSDWGIFALEICMPRSVNSWTLALSGPRVYTLLPSCETSLLSVYCNFLNSRWTRLVMKCMLRS